MMVWYAATNVTALQLTGTGDPQDSVPVELQIYLIEAESDEEAFLLAEELGRDDAAAGSEGLEWNDRPVKKVFLGVMQLNVLFPPIGSSRVLGEGIPEHGAEIAHFDLELRNLDEARLLSKGGSVDLKIWSRNQPA